VRNHIKPANAKKPKAVKCNNGSSRLGGGRELEERGLVDGGKGWYWRNEA
jgi:hypothetical protein